MTQTMITLTKYVILVSIGLLLIYDTIAVFLGGTNATISWVTWKEAHDYPIIPFLTGFLGGHLFFSQTPGKDK